MSCTAMPHYILLRFLVQLRLIFEGFTRRTDESQPSVAGWKVDHLGACYATQSSEFVCIERREVW